MAWPCYLVEKTATGTWRRIDTGEEYPGASHLPPGAMRSLPDMVEGKHADHYRQHLLSDHYLRDWAGKRPPIIVWLPGNGWWNIDMKSSDGGEGWQVTGEPPNLTASPSILTEDYHGWLRDGVLSDDLEGRTYG
jgi:hypothetical protein